MIFLNSSTFRAVHIILIKRGVVCVCVCILIMSLLLTGLLVCDCVSSCLLQPPWMGHHILMISLWSNYSAACTTLSMWHTISAQLAWASRCQPIGCAVTPMSDIFIIATLPIVALRHRGAVIKSLSAFLKLPQPPHALYLHRRTSAFLLFVHSWLLMNILSNAVFQSHFLCLLSLMASSIPLFLILSPCYIASWSDSSLDCPVFVSCLFVCSCGSEARLRQYDMFVENRHTAWKRDLMWLATCCKTKFNVCALLCVGT